MILKVRLSLADTAAYSEMELNEVKHKLRSKELHTDLEADIMKNIRIDSLLDNTIQEVHVIVETL